MPQSEVEKVLGYEALGCIDMSKLLEICEIGFVESLKKTDTEHDHWTRRTVRRRLLTHAKQLARRGSIAINTTLFLENFLYGEGLDVWT